MSRFNLIITFLGLAFFSCKNPSSMMGSQRYFQFSYFDVKTFSYSVQIGPTDSFFLLQHFANNMANKFIDGQTYFALLDSKQKTRLANLLENVQVKTYRKTYLNSDVDGKNLLFCFIDGYSVDSVELSERNGPKELQEIWKWIETEKETLHFISTYRKISWKAGPPSQPPIFKGG
jgi:hypothetical protein